MAARTEAANIHRTARPRPKSATTAINWAEIVILFVLHFDNAAWRRQIIRRSIGLRGSSLPIRPGSAISANFIARLIKGCRVDAHAGCLISEIAKHFQRSNEHFSRESALWARFFCGNRRAKCPS
jgi:hypothetical protein